MSDETPTPPTGPSAASGRRGLRLVGGLFIGALSLFGGYKLLHADVESTDDAMIDAEVVTVSARAAGAVAAVVVTENAVVKAGDLLVQLDEAELTARLHQAQAALAAAEAQASAADAQAQVSSAAAQGGFAAAEAQVTTARAQLKGAEAQVASATAARKRAEAESTRADADWARVSALLATGGVSRQAAEASRAAQAAAAAALEGAQAQLAAAEQAQLAASSRIVEAGGARATSAPVDARIAAAQAGAALAHANRDAAAAALELAQISLSWARITAPADGVVTRVAARVGQLVSPGQQLAVVVPHASYVVANFKETQVGAMAPGQAVEVAVDAFPGETFHGKVDSLSPGTGSRFSLLAPDNASGNFVKVVQRVPVRISWDPQPPVALKPGQSAVVTVHTGG